MQKVNQQKLLFVEGFKPNGLQIRLQRKKKITLVKMVVDDALIVYNLSTFKTLKTHSNQAVQALGVSENDFAWSKPPCSIYQTLFWLEKH